MTLLAEILASGVCVLGLSAQTATTPPTTGSSTKPAAAAAPAPAVAYRNQPSRISKRAAAIYESVWGIADPTVKVAESGLIVRFNYRVLDPEKAKVLADKSVEPLLVCMEKSVRLSVPSFEKIGQLRQAPHVLEAGKSYWMGFSNAGRILKPGDRVDVVIGNFRAQGLELE